MKHMKPILLAIVLASLSFSSVADAAKGNWKKGRIYYKMVCSECHLEQTGNKFSPADKTKAEWADYFAQDIHAAASPTANHSVQYYVSTAYRESVKGTNRAAAKLLKIPDDQLLEDVKAFTIQTAKDSDQPSRCE